MHCTTHGYTYYMYMLYYLVMITCLKEKQTFIWALCLQLMLALFVITSIITLLSTCMHNRHVVKDNVNSFDLVLILSSLVFNSDLK